MASSALGLRHLLKIDCQVGGARVRVWEHDGAFSPPSGAAAHAGLELAWIASGRVRYRVGRSSHVASANDVMVVPAEAEHVTTFVGPVRGVAMWLEPRLLSEVADAAAVERTSTALEPGPTRPRRMPALVSMLERELVDREAGWLLSANALVESIVLDLLRATAPRSASGRPTDARIRAAVDAIQARYADALGVDDLARAAGMSRFHFSRLFREQVGASPYQHLLRVRVARAADLLRRGRRTVTEAAFDVGFSDLGRFSRAFRAQIGCLPSDFAKRSPRSTVSSVA